MAICVLVGMGGVLEDRDGQTTGQPPPPPLPKKEPGLPTNKEGKSD